jgi:response regulator RpfG family c-di-GMP phosphodiesterase
MPPIGASALQLWNNESDDRPVVIAVDDEILVPIAWSRHLRRDFRIIPTANAARALHLLATMERVDLLAVDLHMPTMHGGELLRVAERCFPTVPRILITGEHDNTAVDALVGAVALSDVLYKPLSSRELGQYIEATLLLEASRRSSTAHGFRTPQMGMTLPFVASDDCRAFLSPKAEKDIR